jgi:histone H3
MRFFNHHYTHNSDVPTCARLKRTPATINITNHGPCQTNGRKSTWGAPPRLHLATKAARAAAQKVIAVRKPHCWCPGTVAAREICMFQKTTDLLIRKAPFQRVVQEIIQQVSRKSDLRMQSTALLALQEAVEYFMVDVFNNTNLCALHDKHKKTIRVKDLVLAWCCIQGIGTARA